MHIFEVTCFVYIKSFKNKIDVNMIKISINVCFGYSPPWIMDSCELYLLCYHLIWNKMKFLYKVFVIVEILKKILWDNPFIYLFLWGKERLEATLWFTRTAFFVFLISQARRHPDFLPVTLLKLKYMIT